MTSDSRKKRPTATVGDLIAAAYDVSGQCVDRVVDLLRFDEMRRRTRVFVEGYAGSERHSGT